MLFRVVPGGLAGVVSGLAVVSVSDVGVVRGCFVIALLMVAGSLLVVVRSLLMMLRGLAMMLRSLFRHSLPSAHAR